MKHMKRCAAVLVLLAALICLSVTAFAADPVTAGFTVRNIGKDPVTVQITSGEETEELTIGAESTKDVSFSFEEPDTYEYTITKKDAEPEDPAYIIRIFVESDEEGTLTSCVIPQIKGETTKPEEIIFGNPEAPAVPQTGDHSNASLYGFIMLGASVAFIVLSLVMLRKRKNRRKR